MPVVLYCLIMSSSTFNEVITLSDDDDDGIIEVARVQMPWNITALHNTSLKGSAKYKVKISNHCKKKYIFSLKPHQQRHMTHQKDY